MVFFLGTIFRAVFGLAAGLFKLCSAILGILLGVLVMLWFLLDELPLGDPPAEIAQAADSDYLDMHVHVAGIGAGNSGCFISPQLRDSYKFRFYLHAFGITEERLLERGDGVVVEHLSNLISESRHVGRAVVLALDGVVNEAGELDREKTEVYVPNEFVVKETAKHDNLLFGASINPYRPDALRRLVSAKRQGAVLVKWIPSIMHIDPADERLIPFYLSLIELDLPLLTHAGKEASFIRSEDDFNDPERLELPLRLGVTVIAAHIATTGEKEGVDNFYRLLPLFKKYPNLYADISSLTQINKMGYLSAALKLDYLSGRLIYGSDWPLQFFPLVSPWYQLKDISPATARYIFKLDNAWDRDVLLKKAMGVPEDVFLRSEQLLTNRRALADVVGTVSDSVPQPDFAPGENLVGDRPQE
ncbi:MAG: amidohydrolase family protein [Bdellovibrionales bacterium]|nr:amidohydrolase family protein [Bdellovibrionales bacterium]